MAKFLTTLRSQAEIESIISDAKNSVVMISPFVKIPETLMQSLKDAGRRKVRITFVYGKDELSPEAIRQFEQLDNLTLRFLKNLHAKCFYNEESMVITSLNLYESSQGDNREMGVLLNRKDDEDCFRDAVREANLIVNSSDRMQLKPPTDREKPKHAYFYEVTTPGYCIRCKEAIPLNPGKPLCRNCYDKWAEWGNPDYEEKFCHSCAKPDNTTIGKPLCHSCYKKLFC